MPTWSLQLLESPLNRASGSTGIVTTLTAATIQSPSFALADIDTVSFTIPRLSYQAALVVPFASDVLLWHESDVPGAVPEAIQRFRVTGRTIPVGRPDVTFSASSYRELLNARIFHDGDHLDWPLSMTGTMEQADIAWAIIQQEQAKVGGALGIVRGHLPATQVQRAAFVTDVSSNTTPQHFFTIGESVGQAIESKLAGIENGFEWDLTPDPANPTTQLVFDVWNADGRGQKPSPLVLTEDRISPDATLTEVASDYANVIRAEGGSSTVDGRTLPSVVVYVPSSGNPVPEAVPTGRWEKALSSTDLQTTTQVTDYAIRQSDLATEIRTWTIPLQPGVWTGPSQLWLGDYVRISLEIITEYDDGRPAGTLLSVDEELRVLGLSVAVGTNGAETVTLSVNHPKTKFVDGPIPAQLGARLARLERRT